MLVRSEGGLLPGDVLVRIAAQDRDLGGLTDADYHLGPRERVREAIAQSWARLTTSWEVFSAAREEAAEGDTTGRLTRERWTLPLFTELGYGRLVKQPGPKIEAEVLSSVLPVAAQPDPSRRGRGTAGSPDPERRRRRRAVATQPRAGTAQPLARASLGHRHQRPVAATATRQRHANPSGLRRVRCRGDLRRGGIRGLRAAVAVLPPVASRGRRAPRVLARTLDGGRPARRHPRSDRPAHRRRVRHRGARPGLSLPAGQRRPAGRAAGRHARRPGVLPGAAAPRLPAAVPVRGRGPRRSAAIRRRL